MVKSNGAVMVFGVFDGLHAGHLSFLRQARVYGATLAVVVARDKSAEMLKGRMPRESELKRLRMIRALPIVDKTILGDDEQGAYGVIEKLRPGAICVGYDQSLLQKDLEEKMEGGAISRIPIMRLASYHPEEFHSSIKIVSLSLLK